MLGMDLLDLDFELILILSLYEVVKLSDDLRIGSQNWAHC